MAPAPPDPIEVLLSLLPYTLFLLTCFFIAIPMCWRKGRSIGWAFLILFPLGGVLALFYLASLTDKQVLDRLAELEAKLAGR